MPSLTGISASVLDAWTQGIRGMKAQTWVSEAHLRRDSWQQRAFVMEHQVFHWGPFRVI